MASDLLPKPIASLDNVRRLTQLKFANDTSYVFDFDGVLSSSLEDDIYHLPPCKQEENLLIQAQKVFKIPCNRMAIQYQRHLIYQAAAWALNLPIEPGPALALAQELSSRAKLFILTARSGWYAIERMRDFLIDREITPVEIYHVGRVAKDRQIELLCRELVPDRVAYIEDSIHHLEKMSTIRATNLEMYLVERHGPKFSLDTLMSHYESTVIEAIELWDTIYHERTLANSRLKAAS